MTTSRSLSGVKGLRTYAADAHLLEIRACASASLGRHDDDRDAGQTRATRASVATISRPSMTGMLMSASTRSTQLSSSMSSASRPFPASYARADRDSRHLQRPEDHRSDQVGVVDDEHVEHAAHPPSDLAERPHPAVGLDRASAPSPSRGTSSARYSRRRPRRRPGSRSSRAPCAPPCGCARRSGTTRRWSIWLAAPATTATRLWRSHPARTAPARSAITPVSVNIGGFARPCAVEAGHRQHRVQQPADPGVGVVERQADARSERVRHDQVLVREVIRPCRRRRRRDRRTYVTASCRSTAARTLNPLVIAGQALGMAHEQVAARPHQAVELVQ